MQTTKLSKKVWFSLVFYGLIGQIAWVVENMYFATLCQDIFGYAGRADLSYIITTLMVILSAITATLTTFIAGAFSDRLGKRKPFIGWGYFVWGLTIMLFALIPMRIDRISYFRVAFMLIFFDCLMTVAGSTSNDAAFNAWVADRTDSSNRGLVNTILSMMPVFAVIVVFIGLVGSLYSAEKESNHMFFIFLGCFPLIAGLFVPLLVDDNSKTEADKKTFRWRNVFYGFQSKIISENKMLYIPANFEGRFQELRICFSVLIPMIIGPIVSLFIGLNGMGINE